MLKRSATPVAAQPTTITANPGVSSIDRATWAEQADHLARKYARAEAFQWGPVMVVVVTVGVVAVYQFANVNDDDLALGALAALLVGAVAVAWRSAWVYADKLRAATAATERATWAREVERGEDIDGDGVVGDPFRGITVPRKGGGTETITFSHPPSSQRGEPILDGWGICASDLVAMLYEAEMSRGLGEREWVGPGVAKFTLPSGKQVTQSMFRGVQAALAEHDMASKPAGKWQLDVTADSVAKALANLK